jgi:hypothetical protein
LASVCSGNFGQTFALIYNHIIYHFSKVDPDMSKKLSIAIILIVSVFIVISCSKSGTTGGGNTLDCNTVTNKAFAADINPIFQSFCNVPGCHAAGSTNGPGPLTTYSEFFNARTLIRPAISSGRMPQSGTLSSSQKNSILCWIDGGAPNN